METKQRPVFLTVLCILSFVLLGYNLIMLPLNLMVSPDEEELIEQQEMLEDLYAEMEDDSNFMSKYFSSMSDLTSIGAKNIVTTTIIGFISFVLSLLGVIQMWRMKRNGFAPYIIGELLTAIAPLILFGSAVTSNPFLIGVFVTILFFDIVFIVLYGLNLKHMS